MTAPRDQTRDQARAEGRPRRRWPLLAIGASAGTATWSGWVGLGELTGFGIVHPLPGIADRLTVNTAVTLPIGVEAYAMYALSIATTSRPLPDRTRRYAWASSAAALILGMAGQIAYHLMTASGSAEAIQSGRSIPEAIAPWWVIALVSCLPVIVLGAASLLWHLAGEPAPVEASLPTAVAEVEPQSERDDEPATTSEPALQPSIGKQSSGAVVTARAVDVSRVRDAISSGQLSDRPTAQSIRALLAISPAYARAARDAVTTKAATEQSDSAAPKNSEYKAVSQQDQHEETITEKADQEVSKVTEAEPTEESPGKYEVHHTYATQLT